jgi:hypothetical protein
VVNDFNLVAIVSRLLPLVMFLGDLNSIQPSPSSDGPDQVSLAVCDFNIIATQHPDPNATVQWSYPSILP